MKQHFLRICVKEIQQRRPNFCLIPRKHIICRELKFAKIRSELLKIIKIWHGQHFWVRLWRKKSEISIFVLTNFIAQILFTNISIFISWKHFSFSLLHRINKLLFLLSSCALLRYYISLLSSKQPPISHPLYITKKIPQK